MALAVAMTLAGRPQTTSELPPLDVARILATRYPQEISVSYIPALAWSGAVRLSAVTGETRWEQKARREMQPFMAGEKPTMAPPYTFANLAGHLALSDLAVETVGGFIAATQAASGMARKAADLILPQSGDEIARFLRWWTDDMFMATSLLARVGARTGDDRYSSVIGATAGYIRRQAAASGRALRSRRGGTLRVGPWQRLRGPRDGRRVDVSAGRLARARGGARDLSPTDARDAHASVRRRRMAAGGR